MSFKIKENEAAEQLVAFCLMKGVQPEELITAIFEREYISIETLKNNDHVYLIVSYKEDIEDNINIITMKYTYNLESQLQRIDQKINNSKYKIQWDRTDKLKEIIKSLAGDSISEESLFDVLNKLLPEKIYTSIIPQLKLVI
ncbi:hypothetical protein P7V44_03835 [Providencia sp. CRE-3FA-0001]|uniref:Uncharacterized protein n=1 Tax=Providencia huashanensis TaxID=3037798 RepID=A0AA42FLU1_9GAMM|nr:MULTISPECIES: hypothetical protein [Providencia]EJD6662063.1 hypothetical protein [Providencia rettgeri]ELR5171824.1 hypothetical protein [Providencia rettgeri]ELR5196563.1 hypothetical protein [Providencia rettgeri]EMB8478539.1 hypothetical protein [Providencia rettgeri]MBQ0305770.1 hypothetical protein [Providencia rettgeri]